MDWQVIILTLGASLITGTISLIGNIIVTKANFKKTILENKELIKKEFMCKRMDAYNQILRNINYIEENLNDKEVLEESKIERAWLNWYPYCSKELNHILSIFIKSFDKKEKSNIVASLSNIRKQIKNDLDGYYCIVDKDYGE